MTIIPFSQRVARRLSTLTRPLRRREAYVQLKELDTHMLRDIGLTRLDVEDMRRLW